MTKKVRIENADTANFKVIVEVWDKGRKAGKYHDGEQLDDAPDTLAFTINLDHPAQMTGDNVYLTSTRYIVVKEAP